MFVCAPVIYYFYASLSSLFVCTVGTTVVSLPTFMQDVGSEGHPENVWPRRPVPPSDKTNVRAYRPVPPSHKTNVRAYRPVPLSHKTNVRAYRPVPPSHKTR